MIKSGQIGSTLQVNVLKYSRLSSGPGFVFWGATLAAVMGFCCDVCVSRAKARGQSAGGMDLWTDAGLER